MLKPTHVAPGDIYSKLVHHHHFTLGAFYSWGVGVGLGLEGSVQMGGMSWSNYLAHPVFVFPNHFLFCFYFRVLFSFNKPHWLPTIYSPTCCPPFGIKVQATYDLIYSQNSPVSEEKARLLFPKTNQGPEDQEGFYASRNSYHYFSSMHLQQFSTYKALSPICSHGILTASWWWQYFYNQGGHTSWLVLNNPKVHLWSQPNYCSTPFHSQKCLGLDNKL